MKLGNVRSFSLRSATRSNGRKHHTAQKCPSAEQMVSLGQNVHWSNLPCVSCTNQLDSYGPLSGAAEEKRKPHMNVVLIINAFMVRMDVPSVSRLLCPMPNYQLAKKV